MNAKDFQIGQKVWVVLDGNARRGKSGEELIEEWEIVSIGRRYITASKYPEASWAAVQFDVTNNLKQKNDGYSPDYILYMDKESAYGAIEREELQRWFRKFPDSFHKMDIPLERLRKAKEILEGKEGKEEKEAKGI